MWPAPPGGQVFGRVIEARERVRHDRVDPAADQQRIGILLRAAHADFAINAGAAIEPIGQRQIITAMFRLGAEVWLTPSRTPRS